MNLVHLNLLLSHKSWEKTQKSVLDSLEKCLCQFRGSWLKNEGITFINFLLSEKLEKNSNDFPKHFATKWSWFNAHVGIKLITESSDSEVLKVYSFIDTSTFFNPTLCQQLQSFRFVLGLMFPVKRFSAFLESIKFPALDIPHNNYIYIFFNSLIIWFDV